MRFWLKDNNKKKLNNKFDTRFQKQFLKILTVTYSFLYEKMRFALKDNNKK